MSRDPLSGPSSRAFPGDILLSYQVGWTTGGEKWDGNDLNGHPVPICQVRSASAPRIALNAPTNHQNANILKAAKEQRLAETESALYGALVTLSSMGPTTTLLQATMKPDSLQKSKAARMDEWTRMPLRDWPDIYHWKASMCDQFTLNQSQEVPLVDHLTASHAISASPAATTIHSHSPQGELETSGPASFAWHPGEDVNMGSPYNAYFRPHGVVSSPTYLRDPAPGPAKTISNPFPDFSTATVTGNSGKEDEHSTMADELSKSKPSIYF
ncbi:uncharacterized protein BO88DRAFT_442397 [Aspergillus vadensis CBS 113365]|uniref:Uncharacterized protein n=1 Tax=Aspergillus vadensis (strain CBS 113365 / IMI 142717 / IBT 24658) TaxID=1448311 RepID=A0A319BFX6_ASPVC|nr:hypothetical protein BO88DRAFT_442397 [Aspergillus vadensis CBS 113365]PYH70964.1 hypothetical protein BO88DRAFT_442397 [Aspergillus vadensis CBS 113365]